MRLTFPTDKSDGSIKDVDSTILEIKKIYVQSEAKKYARTQEILAEYPNAEVTEVDSHWKLDELNQNPELIQEWTQVKAHTLVLGVKDADEQTTGDVEWNSVKYKILEVLKGREGESGRILVHFDLERMIIEEVEVLHES